MKPFTITSVDWHLDPDESWELRSDTGQLYLTNPYTPRYYNISNLGLVDSLKEAHPELFIDIQPVESEIPF